MSQWRGDLENIEEPGDVADLVGTYYHIPAIVALLGFMLWSRTRHWKEFLVDGTVYFDGFDPWYHYRMVAYTVQNWPATSPFDPWTYFPFGTHSSQFGTIMDQIVALVALVVGLGNPSDHTIRLVVLFAPAVFGTIAAIPIYFIGKRTSGKFAGVIAVATLALVGSTFAQRGRVGFYDHHIAEALFQAVAILATMIAVSVAQEEKPVWELFEARDADALRRPVGWSLVAGVAIALYIWTWAPGVFLFGILGVYFLVELSSQYAQGESPEHVAIAGAITLGTAGVLSLAVMEEIGLSATSYNLVQPLLAFGVAAGCVFLAWLAREWDRRELPNIQYPAAVAGILVVIAGAMALLLPDLWGFLVNQVTRVVGLSTSDTAGTVGEAQSLPFEGLFPKYRFTLVIALVGVAYVVARHFYDRPRSELTLLAVWTVFMLLATLTQRRFDYYFGMTVAVMTAMVIGQFTSYAGLSKPDTEIETYQIITIAAVVLIVFAPLVYPAALSMQVTNAQGGAGPSATAWNESLGWMQNNSPEEGTYGGVDNADQVPYYGTFERTDDFDYPEGYYGVLSWWDYGHFITVMGERIPNANPFQQGSDMAANFLLSQSESQAEDVVERMSEDDAKTRFVMVDWKMAETSQYYQTPGRTLNLGGKYFAPFQFYTDGNISQNDYYTTVGNSIYYRVGQQGAGQQGAGQLQFFRLHKQNYYNSTVVRLYKFHGSAVEPQPVVVDWERDDIQGRPVRMSNGTRRFQSMEAARDYAERDPTAQVGGIGQYPSERVPALEHYRMVSGSESSATESQRYVLGLRKEARGAFRTSLRRPGVGSALQSDSPNWVKAFERVPGATIEGEGPANATVMAGVRMQVPSTNSTFVYRQQAETGDDGTFTMTVPYSTTGYDEWAQKEGYTNASVRAVGPYRLRTDVQSNETHSFRYGGTVNVTEAQVIGEESSPVEITLEKGPGQVTEVNTIDQNGTDGNETADDGQAGEETTDGTTTPTGDSTDGSTATPNDATATPSDASSTSTDSTGSALIDPTSAGPVTLVALLGAGLFSLVTLSKRD